MVLRKKTAPKYLVRPPSTKSPTQKFPRFLFLVSLFCAWLVYASFTPQLPELNAPPRLYSNQSQQDLRQIFADAIRRSCQSIYLVMFGLSDPTILSLLENKIDEGVQAKVYYDLNHSPNLSEVLEGGEIHPVKLPGLMHHKILILDDATVFLGSANMTTHSLRMHDNLVLGLVNRRVAEFLKSHAPHTPGYLRTMVGGQDIELWLLPDPKGKALAALRRRLQTASRSIRLALFTLTHQGIVDELIQAHQRGVEVSIVVDMHSGMGASAAVVQQLHAAGIRLYFSQGTQLLHHKFAYIDEQTLLMGSANWTKAAFTKNADSLVMLHSLNSEQRHFLDQLWERIETEAKIYVRRY